MCISACHGFGPEAAAAPADPIDWFAMSSEVAYCRLNDLSDAERIRALRTVDPVSGKTLFVHIVVHSNFMYRDVYFQFVSRFPELVIENRKDIFIYLAKEREEFTWPQLGNLLWVIGENSDLLDTDPFLKVVDELIKNRPNHAWRESSRSTFEEARAASASKIEELRGRINEREPDEAAALYFVAFVCGYIRLVEPFEGPIPPYSINLLWYHQSSPEEGEAPFSDRCMESFVRWAEMHPGAQVNFWYDGSKVSAVQIDAYRASIEERLPPEGKIADLRLRDIHCLSLVSEHPELFGDDVPPYFKVDILKCIIPHSLTQNGECRYSMMVDIDVTPESAEVLFEKRTVRLLEERGIVVANSCLKPGDNLVFENSVVILNGGHEICVREHEKCIQHFIRHVEDGGEVDDQSVYECYPSLVAKVTGDLNLFGSFVEFKTGFSGQMVVVFEAREISPREMIPRKNWEVPISRFYIKF